jgi:hypothetical protein
MKQIEDIFLCHEDHSREKMSPALIDPRIAIGVGNGSSCADKCERKVPKYRLFNLLGDQEVRKMIGGRSAKGGQEALLMK